MSTPVNEPVFQVRWPDGGIYVNSTGKTRLTEPEARGAARRIGGTWRRVTKEAPGADAAKATRECRHHGEVPDDHFPCRAPGETADQFTNRYLGYWRDV